MPLMLGIAFSRLFATVIIVNVIVVFCYFRRLSAGRATLARSSLAIVDHGNAGLLIDGDEAKCSIQVWKNSRPGQRPYLIAKQTVPVYRRCGL